MSLKLYLWHAPYEVSYGSSFLFVIAPNLRQARKLAKEKCKRIYKDYEQNISVDVFDRKPDLVRKLPYAGCVDWSE